MTTSPPAARTGGLDHVLSPFDLKGLTLRNRVVRASQGTGLGIPLGGRVGDDMVAWHTARARGGVALSFIDMGGVHWSSPGLLDLSSDGVVDGLRHLSDACHAEGMLVFQQLLHGGPTNLPADGSAPWSASAIPDPGLGALSIPMTAAMIAELVEAFAASARRMRDGGIDGLEVHAGHGYLFSAFLSPATNRREDAYGGDLAGRGRLLAEVLAACRAATDPDFVIGVRLSPDGPEDQTTAQDLADLVAMFERDGLIDYVNVSLGSHYQRELLMGGADEPRGYQLPTSSIVTKSTALPTMVTGRIMTLAEAEDVVASGTADLVSMVRATIADPDLVIKSAAGRAKDVRPCISCNQGCAGGINVGRVACTVNAGAGRELQWGDATVHPAVTRRRVVVVGGGPGGLEAARVAALAGHEVILLEAEDELGGQLRLVRRAEANRLLPWFTDQLAGVDVRLGRRATVEDLRALAPDVLVLATGAVPRTDGFQTWRPGRTLTAPHLTGWEVLRGADVGSRVLVLDETSHYESFDVLDALVARGCSIDLVTRFATVGARVEMRWEMISGPRWAGLRRAGVRLHARSMITEAGDGAATISPVDAPDLTETLAYDSLVLLCGQLPDWQLREDVTAAFPDVRVIGDVNGPRGLHAAITEGQLATRDLDAPWERSAGQRYGQSGSAI